MAETENRLDLWLCAGKNLRQNEEGENQRDIFLVPKM